jgi:rhodanese-related sulfurtransferase
MKWLVSVALLALLAAVVAIFEVRGGTALSGVSEDPRGYQTLTPKEAKARMDSGDPLVILDVRTRSEYDTGHIAGAVCLPNEDIGSEPPAALPDKDAEILVYCRSGRRSAEAAEKLAALGYTGVADFGGIISWPYGTVKE